MEAKTFLTVILMIKCQFLGKPQAWPRDICPAIFCRQMTSSTKASSWLMSIRFAESQPKAGDGTFRASTRELTSLHISCKLAHVGHLFFMKTSMGFQDGHIWYSIFSCSARSNFTCVQRGSCCFSCSFAPC
ncbi:hypothetical protein mRhiFer1_009177 [Rhinolophus ferrumequinum]|uniref:Uncharacterized protein n=1 Tax=Rhinolophus ferrumequinum TaxID=59479 RepID=A0A7J7SJL6_RHIFE|nr:hypothetical protein mRhiFer1_009177 [Rhinolophus ferrumequinum]